MSDISRRDLFKAAAAGAALTIPIAASAQEAAPAAQPAAGAQQQPAPPPLAFFDQEQARFVTAAIDRLIPADEQWAGARDAGVLVYIDRQLAGAYGAGAHMYLAGPWTPDAPAQQGYQLRYAPAQLYRTGIAEARAYTRAEYGDELWALPADSIDAVLRALESGEAALRSVPAPFFFETLLANTIEGYFADPAYGGNRDMVSWRMIGFPGALAQYVELVDAYDYKFDRPPVGIADVAPMPAMNEGK